MTYDEATAKVAQIADDFRTYSALIGCSMFYTIGMFIDRFIAAWPDPAGTALAVAPWAIALTLECFVFEAVHRRTVARLHGTLRAWFLCGPGARGARLITVEPLDIVYEDCGRRWRAAITFLWRRIRFESGSAGLLGQVPT